MAQPTNQTNKQTNKWRNEMPQMNFDEVPDSDLLDADKYHCELVKVEEGTSKAGFEKIDLQWKVVNGPAEGRMLFDTISFAPRALVFSKRKLVALGVAPNKKNEILADMFPLNEVFMLTVGIQASKTINPETGEMYPDRNTVKGYGQPSLSARELAH